MYLVYSFWYIWNCCSYDIWNREELTTVFVMYVCREKFFVITYFQNAIAEISRFGNWNHFSIANTELGHLFKTELHCDPVDDIYSIQLGYLYVAVLWPQNYLCPLPLSFAQPSNCKVHPRNKLTDFHRGIWSKSATCVLNHKEEIH
jgi:hypothetical protein